jgi:DNA-binding MarR family transcriptional regulator
MARPSRWTFLTNHAVVLLEVWRNPDLTAKELAGSALITERAVHRIHADLTEAGYLTRSRNGRKNHYSVSSHGRLRHPMFDRIPIEHLLELLATDLGPRS